MQPPDQNREQHSPSKLLPSARLPPSQRESLFSLVRQLISFVQTALFKTKLLSLQGPWRVLAHPSRPSFEADSSEKASQPLALSF